MTDITVYREQHKTTLISNTDKGKRWLLENMFIGAASLENVSVKCFVDTDSVQDTINFMVAEGLEVS